MEWEGNPSCSRVVNPSGELISESLIFELWEFKTFVEEEKEVIGSVEAEGLANRS